MAEIDIVPELLAQIQQDFNQAYKNDTKIQQLADKISSGKADYADAQEFAQRTGELMAAALQKNITADKLPNGQMYYNIADRILGTMLKTDYGIVAKKAAEVQQHLNENAGLGLKAQTADYDEENAKSIIDKVSASEDFNKVSYMLKAPVETFSMKVVDDTIKKNADFHYKAGLKPRIVRSAETKCCDWCASLDGTYEYPGVPKEVFARHNNCRCTVNYDPRDGKVQNVWNKKEWKDAEEYDKIEMRKSIRLEDDRDSDKAQIRIKANKENSLFYRKEKGEPYAIKTQAGMLQMRKLIDSPLDIYISDKLNIKPKAIHEYELEIAQYVKKIGIPKETMPLIGIVDSTETGRIYGAYLPAHNAVILPLTVDREKRTTAIIHELFHCYDRSEYILSGNSITNDEEYALFIEHNREYAKKRITSIGLNTEEAISGISEYAYTSWIKGKYEEVWTEYRTKSLYNGGSI